MLSWFVSHFESVRQISDANGEKGQHCPNGQALQGIKQGMMQTADKRFIGITGQCYDYVPMRFLDYQESVSMSEIVNVTDATFEEQVLKADIPVLV